jgi:hypothetical protein
VRYAPSGVLDTGFGSGGAVNSSNHDFALTRYWL